MGEATFNQGKDDEAIFYFRKVVEKYPESEFYAFALYSCGWIQLRKEAYEEAHQFFSQVYGKNPSHPMAETSLSGRVTAFILSSAMQKRSRRWRLF
jgi:TolA-binding protein